MGDYSVIRDVGETLKGLLESIVWEDLGLRENDEPKILLRSPKELDKVTDKYLILLFLYQVQENDFMKNREIQHDGSTKLSPPPVILDLYYLIIPFINERDLSDQDRETEHRMLGKIIQKLHDHAILSGSVLKGSLEGSTEELRLLLDRISLDDLNKLWTSFPEMPYRLSVSYLVTPVYLESEKEILVKRVTETKDGYYEMEKKK